MTGPNDDLSLIAACRAGRTDAFGMLVQKYQDRLYPTALRLTGGVEDALDLLQETFLRAFLKLKGFHGDSSFFTWVYRIMVNLANSERRRPNRLRRAGAPGGTVAMPVDPPDPSEDSEPSYRLQRLESERFVQGALDRLAPDHRVVLVLKEYDGLRYEEIAATLGVPVGTVRSRLHRARAELRGYLGVGEADAPAPPAEPARVGPGDPSSSSILPLAGTRPASSLAFNQPEHHDP